MTRDEERFYHELGLALRLARKAKRLRQEDVASLLDCDRTCVAKVEAGMQRLDCYTLNRMQAIFGITLPGVATLKVPTASLKKVNTQKLIRKIQQALEEARKL